LNGIDDRRAKLSAEKRALLEKRLKGLTVAAAEPQPPVERVEEEPADTSDLTLEDYGLRPLHPLLSSAQWRRELLTAGFVDFATFTAPGSAAEVLGVDVNGPRRGDF
jgi:hypothetical protein